MLIAREHYLRSLIDRRHNGMIKVITGVRRCGKSFLLTDIYHPYLNSIGVEDKQIITLALDDDINIKYRNPIELGSYIRSLLVDKESMYYVILDEIQKVEEIQNPYIQGVESKIGFVDVLLGLMKLKNVDLYVTGSNSKFLSSDILTEFRGRGDEIRVYPLSFSEFYSAKSGKFSSAWNEYQTFGGLPAIMSMQTEIQKADYLRNLFSNVYLKDVIERNGVKSVDELNDVVNILASSIGTPTNPTKISNTFLSEKKTICTNKTVSKYIDYLEDAFLVSKAIRYDIKGRRYIDANLKYYFVDMGLRNARLNFRQQEVTHMMENIIFNELLVRGYNVDVGVVEINTKNAEGKSIRKQLEIDFVINQSSQRFYVQAAYEMYTPEKQNQERRSLMNVDDSFKKIIIVRDDIKPWHDDNGFLILGLEDFLLNEYSLENF